MPSELTSAGIAALKAGDRSQARGLLTQATQEDPSDELAWLWLSGAVEGDAERRTALEHVLAINPANAAARSGLAQLPPAPIPDPSPTRDPSRDQTPLPLPPEPVPEPATTPTPPTTTRQQTGCAILLVLGILVTMFACSQVWSGAATASRKPSDAAAWVACKGFVEDRLKAPSSAKFPMFDASYVSAVSESYRVRAYVDAQNSFGATIRTSFDCRLDFQELDGTWRLTDLTMP